MSKAEELSRKIIGLMMESDCDLAETLGALRAATMFFDHEASMKFHAGCAIKEPDNAPQS
ncbi:MAG: hypothetical protein AUJ56_08015 [Zetaproteobacteria bacterium CG1_02_49_23]|nr:MAG: hypothetical protein AUJ56_08015 [Zetaproteobacteria bacterium CG1_02_49_23]